MVKNTVEQLDNKKIAIVADWLTTYGGAEKVVLTVHEMFPDAPIYTSQYSRKNLNWFDDCDVRTGWVNIFPSFLRKILSIPRAIYFSRLNLKEYDVIISISTAESKGIKTSSDQLHISYLQGPPIQYFWGMYDQYVENPGFGRLNFLVRFFFKLLVKPLRRLDYKFAQRPDYLLANSTYSSLEIKKYYNRDSIVVFPPVEVSDFKLNNKKEDFFISTSRQVNWKRLDLAVGAFKKTGDQLILVGGGAEHNKLVKLADGVKNIKFIPMIKSTKELSDLVGRAKAFVFPSLEPFGIAPIEALSTGTPIIAFKQGGALDYIRDGENGVFFEEQTVESLISGMNKLKLIELNGRKISATARRFSAVNFKSTFKHVIMKKINEKN